MSSKLRYWFSPKPIEFFNQTLSRERLIQSSRIIIIDDEEPLLISELRSSGYSVDHDKTGNDQIRVIDQQVYDLVILDYQGVGQKLGQSQGLALLKHIRRVSPRTRIMAYTSRSLSATEAEFFRLSHTVLPKDLGLEESFAQIDQELKKAFAKEHLFESLIEKLNITDPKDRDKIYKTLSKTLSKNNEGKFKEDIIKVAGVVASKSVEIIIARLFGV